MLERVSRYEIKSLNQRIKSLSSFELSNKYFLNIFYLIYYDSQ